MKLLFPEAVESKKATARKFDNAFMIFKEGESRPFAYRAPNSEYCVIASLDKYRNLFEFDRFHLFGNEENIYCKYNSTPSLTACFSLLDKTRSLGERDVDNIASYLAAAYNIDPNTLPRMSAISSCEKLVSRVADFCGCLTDIYREDVNENRYVMLSDNKPKGGFIAAALPIIALMYRRISALRGFNFKVSFSDSLACLGFSAKVLIDGEKYCINEIPEYSVLCELADTDDLIIAARLTKIPEEECKEIRRLSIVICPQDIDPRGILRAPELIKLKENIIDKFDFDIPGKY